MPLIVSISSLKGGVGKTSVTLGLASAALAANKNVLVVDMDPHGDASTGLAVEEGGTDIGTLLAHPKKYSLAAEVTTSRWNTIAQSATIERRLQSEVSPQVDEQNSSEESTELSLNEYASGPIGSIDVVRGSAATTSLESLPSHKALPRLKQLLDGEIEDYDIVLIDCPPTLGRLTSMAWAVSDRVISIAEPSLFSVAGTERTLRAIARFEENTDYSVSSASVVINKVRKNDPEHSYRMEEMRNLFAELVAEPALDDFEGFQRIQGSAFPVHFWPEPAALDFSNKLSNLLDGLLR